MLIPKIGNAPVSLATIFKKQNIKDASLSYRRDIMQANKRQMYMNEYDRLKGMLTSNISHGHHDFDRLKNRQDELKLLYANSFGKHNPHDFNKITKKEITEIKDTENIAK